MSNVVSGINRREFIGAASSTLAALTAPPRPLLAAENSTEATLDSRLQKLFRSIPEIGGVKTHALTGAKTVVVYLKQEHPSDLKELYVSPSKGGRNSAQDILQTIQGEIKVTTASLVRAGVVQDFFVETLDSAALRQYQLDIETLRKLKKLDALLPPELRESSMRDPAGTLRQARANGSPHVSTLEAINALPRFSTSSTQPPLSWLAALSLNFPLKFHLVESPEIARFYGTIRSHFQTYATELKFQDGKINRYRTEEREGRLSAGEANRLVGECNKIAERASEDLNRFLKSEEYRANVYTKRQAFAMDRIGEYASANAGSSRFVGLIFGQKHNFEGDIDAWNLKHPEHPMGIVSLTVKSLLPRELEK